MNLQQKYDLYLNLIKDHQDSHGFIESDRCDSLIFTSLTACNPNIRVRIEDAFDKKTNTWQRRPIENSCYPEHSKSTISRDQLLGLAWYCWVHKRKDISEQIVSYALSHGGFMGKGSITAINIMPSLLSTYANIVSKLGGKKRHWLTWIPPNPGEAQDGYQAHLQILHILLRLKVCGELFKDDKKDIADLIKKQPLNALFQYAGFNFGKAEELLMNTKFFPEDRLPTSYDRKEQWLWQRDYGKAWLPDTENPLKVHSGGDFLFVAGMLLRKF